jgi:hypothetical protein
LETGNYYTSFVGSTTTTTTVGGGVQFELNGTGVGPTATLAVAGAPLVLDAVIEVTTTPSVLKVVVRDQDVEFAIGDSASISIVQLSNP